MPSPRPRTVFVTGASRGIGLEFVRQCLDRGDRVLATCRNPDRAEPLARLAAGCPDRCVPLRLDVGDAAQIDDAARRATECCDRIDLLINNAGMLPASPRGLEAMDADDLLTALRVNVLGPMLVTRSLLPLLRAGERGVVLCLSSRVGVTRPHVGDGAQAYGYGISKAALHRAVPQMAAEMKADGILVVGMDPGWVETDMTGSADVPDRYKLDPARAIAGMLRLADALKPEDTGLLWRWTGQLCRWYPPDETPEEMQVSGTDPAGPAAGKVLR